MNKLNISLLPDPFGLQNTGSLCYFNSLLQVLASCTSIQSIVFLDKTPIELIFNNYIKQIKNNNVDSMVSYKIIQELHNNFITFGNGQESASEAFILLLESINNNALNKLFLNRYRCSIYCTSCKYNTEEIMDHSFTINLFHIKELNVENILNYYVNLEDYSCTKCSQKKTVRRYRLTMLSEILFIIFNIYFDKTEHSFPDILNFKQSNLTYKLIGQIEHYGTLSGGHYLAKALRKNNNVYLFNDNYFQDSTFKKSINTYIVIYHLI